MGREDKRKERGGKGEGREGKMEEDERGKKRRGEKEKGWASELGEGCLLVPRGMEALDGFRHLGFSSGPVSTFDLIHLLMSVRPRSCINDR